MRPVGQKRRQRPTPALGLSSGGSAAGRSPNLWGLLPSPRRQGQSRGELWTPRGCRRMAWWCGETPMAWIRGAELEPTSSRRSRNRRPVQDPPTDPHSPRNRLETGLAGQNHELGTQESPEPRTSASQPSGPGTVSGEGRAGAALSGPEKNCESEGRLT